MLTIIRFLFERLSCKRSSNKPKYTRSRKNNKGFNVGHNNGRNSSSSGSSSSSNSHTPSSWSESFSYDSWLSWQNRNGNNNGGGTCPGGINSTCSSTSMCANGLTCVQGSCICAKPSQVTNALLTSTAVEILNNVELHLVFDFSPDADYYNVVIYGNNGPVLTALNTTLNSFYVDVPFSSGSYSASVISGSNDCGTNPEAVYSNTVVSEWPGCTIM